MPDVSCATGFPSEDTDTDNMLASWSRVQQFCDSPIFKIHQYQWMGNMVPLAPHLFGSGAAAGGGAVAALQRAVAKSGPGLSLVAEQTSCSTSICRASKTSMISKKG